MQKHWIIKKVIRHITDNLESSSDDSDENSIKLNIWITYYRRSNLENVFFEGVKKIFFNVNWEN